MSSSLLQSSVVWVESHLLDRVPVASVSSPSIRPASPRLLVDLLSLLENRQIQATVAVGGRDEAYRAVQVLGVVPAQERRFRGDRSLQESGPEACCQRWLKSASIR